jgi:hypothetical protein
LSAFFHHRLFIYCSLFSWILLFFLLFIITVIFYVSFITYQMLFSDLFSNSKSFSTASSNYFIFYKYHHLFFSNKDNIYVCISLSVYITGMLLKKKNHTSHITHHTSLLLQGTFFKSESHTAVSILLKIFWVRKVSVFIDFLIGHFNLSSTI